MWNNLDPTAVTYDSGRGELFVADSTWPLLSVVSDATERVVATIAVPTGPYALCYDPAKGVVLVGEFNQSTWEGYLSVVSDSNNSVVLTKDIGYGIWPNAIAFDPTSHQLMVAISVTFQGEGEVNVYNDTNFSRVATFGAGADPVGIAYDNRTNQLFVANHGTSNLGVLNATSGAVVASVPFFGRPTAVALDATTGLVLVPVYNGSIYNSGTLEVVSDLNDSLVGGSVVNGVPFDVTGTPSGGYGYVTDVATNGTTQLLTVSEANFSVVGAVRIQGPGAGLVYDDALSLLYTTGYYPGTLTAVSPGNQSVVSVIPLSALPSEAFYVQADGTVYVLNQTAGGLSENSLVEISAATGTITGNVAVGTDPQGAAYDPAAQEIFVADRFSESVKVVSTVSNSVVATVPLGFEPGPLAFDAATSQVWVTDPYGGTVAAISDVNNQVVASVTVQSLPSGIAADPVDGTVYVSDFASNNVSVVSDVSDSVVATVRLTGLPNSVGYDPVSDQVLVGHTLHNGSDGVAVLAGASHRVVAEIPTGLVPSGFAVDPVGGEIFVANSEGRTLTVVTGVPHRVLATVRVGLEPTGIAFDPVDHLLFVTNWGDGTVSRLQLGATLTFHQTGLLAATWCVKIDSTTQCVTGRSLSFGDVTVGNHSYAVLPVVNHTVRASQAGTAIPAAGTLSVTTGPIKVGLRYFRTYALSFVEAGLPNGTNWSVTVAGQTSSNITSATSGKIVFEVRNGSYGYSIAPVAGFASRGIPKGAYVNGAAAQVTVTFS